MEAKPLSVGMQAGVLNEGSKNDVVTQVGTTSYAYDNNGNMITRGSQTLTWDVENRPISVNTSPATSFVYDGDRKRVKKTEGGQTTVYANKYYEKNLTTGDITLYYYLGDRMVALKKNANLRYISQDHLTGTSVTSDTGGNMVASIKYMPFGDRRNSTGTIDTDRQFTGQRLDGTGLYHFGARYYDPTVGRFTKADTIVPDFANPQTLNRYSYAINNPLKYVDKDGHFPWLFPAAIGIGAAVNSATYALSVAFSEKKTFSWSGLAGAAVSGAVSGGGAAAALWVSPSAAAAIAWSSLSGAAGYSSGWATQTTIAQGTGGSDSPSFSVKEAVVSAGAAAIGSAFGQVASAGLTALKAANAGGNASTAFKESVNTVEKTVTESSAVSAFVAAATSAPAIEFISSVTSSPAAAAAESTSQTASYVDISVLSDPVTAYSYAYSYDDYTYYDDYPGYYDYDYYDTYDWSDWYEW